MQAFLFELCTGVSFAQLFESRDVSGYETCGPCPQFPVHPFTVNSGREDVLSCE